MSSDEPWTIGRLLAWTTDFLKQHGSESPRLDAEVLLAHARQSSRIELYTDFGEPASDPLRDTFRDLVRQRAAGMPVAYLVGHREFYSLPFRVSRDVLIPRPETESLVMASLDLLRTSSASSLRVADIGTGSGIVAVSLARNEPRARITAVDTSPAALAIARHNAQSLGVADRIEFLESDLCAAIPPERSFDLVASNPPYVRTAEMAELARDVRDYEPRLALEAGPRGTEIIERLIPLAAERLVAGGWLAIEISPMLRPAVEALFAADERFEPPVVVKDSSGQFRVVHARRKM